MPNLEPNPRRLATYHALHMTLFPVSVMTLFWKHDIGMSMTEILVVQGLFGFVMALFEFPSGYIADRLGYRRALMAASALGMVGWAVYSTAHSMWVVIAAEVVLGVAMSLVSGADTAMLYESLHESGREQEFGIWNGRVRFWGQMGEGTAALAAGLLYTWWPPLPFVVQAVVSAINLGVAVTLVEPTRQRPPIENHLSQVRSMVRYAFVENRHLTAIIVLTVGLGLSSFVPVWLVPLYATDAGVPSAWIGPIWAVANYSVALGSLASHRVARHLRLIPTLGVCVALVATGYAGLAGSDGRFGFAWYFCLTVMRGLFGPLLLHEENRMIPSSDRAGFISMRSLVFRLSFLGIAPVIGASVDAHGQHPVLAVLGCALTAIAGTAWLWYRHQRAAPPHEGHE
ncbi:MAG: MFS transporter [Myxococcales bacterium FL481]|nr:MAG: MFS transporter [Myxococcales bacterium FL481]